MWDNDSLRRARQDFADQFEQSGETVLFRWRGCGDPVAISGWERDALIYDFDRRVGWLYAAVVLLVVVILAATAAGGALLHFRPTLAATAMMLVPIALAYAGLQRWIWNAPRRLIAARKAG